MKKILLLILVLFSVKANSQVLLSLIFGDKLNSDGIEFGLEGGFNFSRISGLETKSYLGDYNLGYYFDIRLKDQWNFYTGMLVKANTGVNKLSENDLKLLSPIIYQSDGSYSQVTNYFLVPALLKYNFKNHMYVELGPQAGYMYKSWIEYNSDIEGRDATVKEYNEDQVNNFDVGIIGGVGYKMMKGRGWTIGVKYYYGFIDVYKMIPDTKNNSIFLKLNFPVGVGNKTKKVEEE